MTVTVVMWMCDVAVLMMAMPIMSVRRRRRSQTHLVRSKFPVQYRPLRRATPGPAVAGKRMSLTTFSGEIASILTMRSDLVKIEL